MSKMVEETKSARGQTIIVSHGRDDSSLKLNDAESRNGEKMGGSTTNLAHSLSGASAVQGVKK